MLTLSGLNALVCEAVENALPGQYTIVAEISELRVSGHCYLSFIEKNILGTTVAKASAHIWRSKWQTLSGRFQQVTGRIPGAGMKVLATVEVEMHTLYGYSLNVIDLDPSYTLGDQAAQRQAVIKQLKEDGVFDINKELPLPRPLHRVAVVTSATAAGYGDFCRQIEQSGYHFGLQLYEAIVQGERAPQSIIQQLEHIASARDGYDAVAIIRGGGAVDDLVCFDDYDLASYVANMPLPVLTGIGHERDTSVVDMVAHRAFKTPTAVAAFLIQSRDEEWRLIDDLRGRLTHVVYAQLHEHQQRIALASQRLRVGTMARLSRDSQRIHRLTVQLQPLVSAQLAAHKMRLSTLHLQMCHLAAKQVETERGRIEKHLHTLEILHPQRILDSGYSYTTSQGKLVRDASQLLDGDVLTTRFQKGEAQSVVQANLDKSS